MTDVRFVSSSPSPSHASGSQRSPDPIPESFRRNAWIGFAAAGALILLLAVVAILALRSAVVADRAALDEAQDILEFGRFQSDVDRKVTALRNFVVAGDEHALVDLAAARANLRQALAKLEGRASAPEQKLLLRIRDAEAAHERMVDVAIDARRRAGRLEPIQPFLRANVEPRRVALERSMTDYIRAKESKLSRVGREIQESNRREFGFVLVIAVAALATTLALSVEVTRRLASLFAAERTARRAAEDGEAERAALLSRERMARSQAEGAEERAAFLARASQALFTSLESDETLRAIARLVVPEVCDWCFVDLAGDDEDSVRRIAVTHGAPEDEELARRFEREHFLDPAAAVGSARVLKTGVPELISDVDGGFLEAIARSPEALEVLRGMGIRSAMCVPMRDAESVVGVLTFVSTASGRRFTAEDLRLAEDLAIRAGIAMENARLFELVRQERAAAEWHERRSSFLARASEVLASSLDFRVTLASVARLAVPEIADWCVVDMVDENGKLSTLALHHSDPARVVEARAMGRVFPRDASHPFGPSHVVRTGRPELATDVPSDMLRALARNDEHFRLLERLGLRSYVCVPLEVRGDVLGTITFLTAESKRRYELDDLALAEALSYRVSLAIDNARLYGEAQEAIRDRDEFLSIASHELKTPITTLQIQVQGILRRIQHLGESAAANGLAERMVASERQIERLTHLIDDLLDISRITAGRLDLHIEEVDLAEVVREVSARLEETLSRAGCDLAVHASAQELGQWDRLRLDQVVTNLLSNAMKYGSGRPIEISLTGDAERVRLEVQDQGIGIELENQSRIFERFERAVSGHHYGGLGLGLWIVRQIVDGLDGRLSVESEPGKGSVFSVELPRIRAAVPEELASREPEGPVRA